MEVRTAKHFGQAVRTARKAAGLSQAQVALAAGTSRRVIYQLEAGRPTLRLETALRVATQLGIILTAKVPK